MLEISVIPRRKNEDIIKLLKIVASKADITGFKVNQVLHQTSRRETAPIIVKLVKKNDRMNFYHQRKKVYNLKVNQIVSSVDCTEEDEEVTINNIHTNHFLDYFPIIFIKLQTLELKISLKSILAVYFILRVYTGVYLKYGSISGGQNTSRSSHNLWSNGLVVRVQV